MVNSTVWAEILERANFRCEWVYSDLTRCQNTMSLCGHHRTYERYGNELESDISLLCPVHHMMADWIRGILVGKPVDIVEERFSIVLNKKLSRLDYNTREKFVKRIIREDHIFNDAQHRLYGIDDSNIPFDGKPIEYWVNKEMLHIWDSKIMLLCNAVPDNEIESEMIECLVARQEKVKQFFEQRYYDNSLFDVG